MPAAADDKAPAAGLFLTHERSPRIRRHFRRLVAETESLIKWRLLYNESTDPEPTTKIPYTHPSLVMPSRFRDFHEKGGLLGGYLDVAFIPCVLALPSPHIWLMEYDVDYSGSWHDLFSQFSDVKADLLTSTLVHRSDSPDWFYWQGAGAPDWVDRDFVRGFHPLMRLSRSFAHRYAVMMADSNWQGHYEFTIPTAAVASGASVEDLGGGGPFTPVGRALNYVNDPTSSRLSPGTFVWRPPRRRYFHEAPTSFPESNLLYHPIKPGVRLWNQSSVESE